MPYDTESKSRNADFILIAREGDTTTLGAKGPVKLKNPPALRPVNLKNLSPCPLSASEHNPPPTGGHNPRGEAPSTYPSEPACQRQAEPSEPSEPGPLCGP